MTVQSNLILALEIVPIELEQAATLTLPRTPPCACPPWSMASQKATGTTVIVMCCGFHYDASMLRFVINLVCGHHVCHPWALWHHGVVLATFVVCNYTSENMTFGTLVH